MVYENSWTNPDVVLFKLRKDSINSGFVDLDQDLKVWVLDDSIKVLINHRKLFIKHFLARKYIKAWHELVLHWKIPLRNFLS